MVMGSIPGMPRAMHTAESVTMIFYWVQDLHCKLCVPVICCLRNRFESYHQLVLVSEVPHLHNQILLFTIRSCHVYLVLVRTGFIDSALYSSSAE